jgi:hypothetical protein
MPKVGDKREASCPFCQEKTPQSLKHSWTVWGAWECERCGQNAQTNVMLDEAPSEKS